MPLHDEHGNKKDITYNFGHWFVFKKFVDSDLHKIFTEYLVDCLPLETFNSSFIVKNDIKKIEKESLEILEKHDRKEVLGLFGKTIWNFLAEGDYFWIVKDKNIKTPGQDYYPDE